MQVPLSECSGGLQHVVAVGDPVELLVARAQATQDQHALLEARLEHLDLLEATSESAVALQMAAVLLEGRGANTTQLAAGEGGLEQVRCVDRAAAGGARSDHRVHLIDEQDVVLVPL